MDKTPMTCSKKLVGIWQRPPGSPAWQRNRQSGTGNWWRRPANRWQSFLNGAVQPRAVDTHYAGLGPGAWRKSSPPARGSARIDEQAIRKFDSALVAQVQGGVAVCQWLHMAGSGAQAYCECVFTSGRERGWAYIPCPVAQGKRGTMRCIVVRCCALQSHGREGKCNGISDTMAFQKAAYHVRWRAGADPHVMVDQV